MPFPIIFVILVIVLGITLGIGLIVVWQTNQLIRTLERLFSLWHQEIMDVKRDLRVKRE